MGEEGGRRGRWVREVGEEGETRGGRRGKMGEGGGGRINAKGERQGHCWLGDSEMTTRDPM